MNDIQLREKQITKTSVIGIIANAFLSAFKAAVGLLSGSIAIVLDAVNNLTDALSSVITIVGIKIAKRRPDDEHPFGHGRVEYFSAIIIAAIVLGVGVTSFVESFKKILHPELPDYSTSSMLIVVVAIIVKILLGRFTKKQGEKFNSDALAASGSDAMFDAGISATTLVGIAITKFFHITIDGWLGAAISAFIIKAGYEMLMESVSSVIGARPDSEKTKAIKRMVASMDGVLGAYDLVLHNYGPNSAIGSIHVEIPETMTAQDIHRLTTRIQLAAQEKFNIFLTVGIYAVGASHEEGKKAIRSAALAHDGVLGVHGIFIDDDLKYISFDALTDFTVMDKKALHAAIVNEVGTIFPGYEVSLNFDTNYSD